MADSINESNERKLRISILGGGYVGLVTAACLAEFGHRVDLVEIDKNKCDLINAGEPPIYENGLKELLSIHARRSLHAYTNYEVIKESDMTFICVGTPQGSNGHSDLSIVSSACTLLGDSLRDKENHHVVVVKSTVPPGTTEQLVIPSVLEHSGKDISEIGFAVNPEFLREGMAIYDFMNPDRIVIGSLEEKAGDLVESVYRTINAPIVRTGLTSAEMIKYASNAFLATKISYANEIGNICKRLGIDVYEVMKGVGLDHRIGPAFLNAGAGFGGSCLPKDVSALIALAEDLGEDAVLLRSVMEVNDHQPERMVQLLHSRLGNLVDKKVAILGLAFKEGTDDVRESRSIPIIRALLGDGAHVAAYDPLAAVNMRQIFPDIEYCDSALEALRV